MSLISQPYSLILLLQFVSLSMSVLFNATAKQMKELTIETGASLKEIAPLMPEMTWMQDF